MREILFRGRDIAGNWHYGVPLIFTKDYVCITAPHTYNKAVQPETVGQYTGLTDKYGKKIFEGDIVENDWCFMCGNSVIKFGQYKPLDMGNEYQQGHLGFYLEHIHKADKRSVRKDIVYFANNCEIIGNIHDNPELLKGGE